MGIVFVGIPSPAFPEKKVVIGVLDFETTGPVSGRVGGMKKLIMKELKTNTRVKIVNIRESCGLSDLKRNGYEGAERYKKNYRLDMVLHIHAWRPAIKAWHFDFSLIDLYAKKVREYSSETKGIPFKHWVKGLSKKILVSKDLDRVVRAKKKALKEKE
jgi:hypothetical protein